MPVCRDLPVKQRVECYSFGAPRVGNQEWVAHFNRSVQESWRFAKSEDVYPDVLPFDVFYRHVKGACGCSKSCLRSCRTSHVVAVGYFWLRCT